MRIISHVQDRLHAAAHALSRLDHAAWTAWRAMAEWPWTLPVAFLLALAAVLTSISYEHRRWKKAWLTQLVAQRLSSMRKQRPRPKRARSRQWYRLAAVSGL